MKYIKLSQNKKAKVDNEEYKNLSKYKWYFKNGYAVRKEGAYEPLIQMHRLILGTPKGKDTDHINGNKLDNRKENLRIASRSENLRNTKKYKTNKSGFKGVCFYKRKNQWMVQIQVKSKKIHLGYFKDIKKAAKAYNKAAIEYHGEFAKINNL